MVTFVYFSPKTRTPLFNSPWEFFCRQSAKICPKKKKKNRRLEYAHVLQSGLLNSCK